MIYRIDKSDRFTLPSNFRKNVAGSDIFLLEDFASVDEEKFNYLNFCTKDIYEKHTGFSDPNKHPYFISKIFKINLDEQGRLGKSVAGDHWSHIGILNGPEDVEVNFFEQEMHVWKPETWKKYTMKIEKSE